MKYTKRYRNYGLCCAAILSLTACATVIKNPQPSTATKRAPFASSYQPVSHTDFLIRGATVLTGLGERLEGVEVYIKNGKIVALGKNLMGVESAKVIDMKGKWLTPGIIDVHSHLGVYPSPSVATSSDGNEATNPVTPDVWAEHSVWPQDPQFQLALAGGVTTLQILPGSSNLIGGRGVTLKNIPARNVHAMKFPGAPHSLKMACGENPKRGYGEKGQAPSTRMGNVAGYRAAWIKAKAYKKKWDDYRSGKTTDEPERDLQMETLAGVLSGEILVHNHCYRADEMAVMLDIAREFGYKTTAFHHAVEAYKVADLLAENGVCAAMWSDWWGFKQEAYDFVRENIALVDAAGACAIVHSDSAIGIQHLNQEAAKAMAAGNKMGLKIVPEHAIQWITLNAAKALGVAEQTGSLEPGKMADLVIWDGDPFSVYSKAERVYIDGVLIYDRNNPAQQPLSDFDIGILSAEGERL